MTPIIIVPYRDREQHLRQFVPAIKKVLPSAEILIVEQFDDKPFNRGKIINAGFLFSQSNYASPNYIITHDIDMIPVHVDYSPSDNPTHLAGKASQFGYKMPYAEYFGGVNLFMPDVFWKINGFPNNYWSWGAEDDAILLTIKELGLEIERRPGRFRSLPHTRKMDHKLYAENVRQLKQGRDINDGLTSCEFQVVSYEQMSGYRLLKVML